MQRCPHPAAGNNLAGTLTLPDPPGTGKNPPSANGASKDFENDWCSYRGLSDGHCSLGLSYIEGIVLSSVIRFKNLQGCHLIL